MFGEVALCIDPTVPARALWLVDAAAADAQNLSLLADRQIVRAVDHRFALSNPALVSAPSKKSFSSVARALRRRRTPSNSEGDPGGELRCFSQFFFAHDAFVQLVAIPNSVFKLAIILGQSFDDDVRACRGVLAKRRSEKNSFSDLKSVCHDTLPLNNQAG